MARDVCTISAPPTLACTTMSIRKQVLTFENLGKFFDLGVEMLSGCGVIVWWEGTRSTSLRVSEKEHLGIVEHHRLPPVAGVQYSSFNQPQIACRSLIYVAFFTLPCHSTHTVTYSIVKVQNTKDIFCVCKSHIHLTPTPIIMTQHRHVKDGI
jgi:hypothetical protein